MVIPSDTVGLGLKRPVQLSAFEGSEVIQAAVVRGPSSEGYGYVQEMRSLWEGLNDNSKEPASLALRCVRAVEQFD